VRIRPAALDDAPALEALIEESVMVLQADDYSEAERRGALGTVFGVDRHLIRDGTYFVAEAGGVIVACGGWSRRQARFGVGGDDQALDPERDAARIRAFFVRPGWTRRGIGGQILAACEAAAVQAGFTRFELVATLTGVPLYEAYGYQPTERYAVPLAGGLSLSVIGMSKSL
jgi:GNAT superfamily N-acetyltransferase